MFFLALLASLGMAGEIILTTCGPVSFWVDGRVAPIGRDGVARATRVMDGVHRLSVRDQRGRELAVEKFSMKYEQRLRMAYIDDRLMLVRREALEREVVRPQPQPHEEPVFGSVEIVSAPDDEYSVKLDGHVMTYVGDGAWLSIKQQPGEHDLEVRSRGRLVLKGEVEVSPESNRRCRLIEQRRYSMSCVSRAPAIDFIGAEADEEPVVEPLPVVQPLARPAMSASAFDAYRKQISYSSTNSGRFELVQATAPGKYFTSDQVAALVRLITVNSTRSELVALLAPSVIKLDAAGIGSIIRLFTVNSSKAQAVDSLAPQVHHLQAAALRELLRHFTTDSSRVAAVRSLAPYCEDPANAFAISAAFSTNSARTEAVRLLSQGGRALQPVTGRSR